MQRLKNILVVVLVTIAVAIAAFLAGQVFQKNSADRERETELTSQTILHRIQEQSFLVTKTVFIDQESQIVIDTGSDWSNFWWGQTITAEALMRTDVGVDLGKLETEDIIVDHEQKKISINLPAAEILDTSLDGEIEVITKSGILKKLFLTDTNADYNLALEQLIQDAQAAVASDEEIFTEAENATTSMLELLLAATGYEISIEYEV